MTTQFENKKQLVPGLRFREFDGEWESNLLGKIVTKVGSGSTPLGGVQVYQESGVPFIRSQNVYDNKLYLDNTHISEEIHEQMRGSSVRSSDILLNITGGSIGRSCVVPNEFEEGNVNQHVCIIRLKPKYTPRFLQPFLASHKGQKLIYQGQTGSGREGINFQSIRLFKLTIPSLPEQEKIAAFLSAVDEKIQQLTKKAALLEQYKKGVMQQLFPLVSGQVPLVSGRDPLVSGQVPALRFRDENGEGYPEWEVKRLGDVCESIKSGKSKSNEDGHVPLYGSTGIIGMCSESSHHGRFILIARVGANAGKINMIDDNFGVSDNTLVVVCKPFLLIDYIYYYLDFYNLNRLIFGSGQPLITGGQLKALKFKLPSIKEQQKIASFLSSIDHKRESIQQQIEQTQVFKKGLLQKMFV